MPQLWKAAFWAAWQIRSQQSPRSEPLMDAGWWRMHDVSAKNRGDMTAMSQLDITAATAWGYWRPKAATTVSQSDIPVAHRDRRAY